MKVTPYAENVLGTISVYFDVPNQLLILYSAFIKYLKKKKWKYSGATRRLVGDFNKAKYSDRREIYIIFPLRLNLHETTAVNTLCR